MLLNLLQSTSVHNYNAMAHVLVASKSLRCEMGFILNLFSSVLSQWPIEGTNKPLTLIGGLKTFVTLPTEEMETTTFLHLTFI